MEKYTVKVAVNEYLKAELQIPEELDASELYGLLDTAKKLANISPTKPTKTSSTSMRRGSHNQWTDHEQAIFMKNWDPKRKQIDNVRAIEKALGGSRNVKQIKARAYYLRQNGTIKLQ